MCLFMSSCSSGSIDSTTESTATVAQNLQILAIDDARVGWVVDTHIAICLDAAGLDERVYLAIAPSRLNPYKEGSPQARRSYSGLLPQLILEQAQTNGYADIITARSDASADDSDLPDPYVAALSDPASPTVSVNVPDLGVLGAPQDGCISKANAEVYGSIDGWLLATNGILSAIRQFSSTALISPTVTQSASEYSLCMRNAGYATNNPAESAALARERWYTAKAPVTKTPPEEIDMAVADARCQLAHPVLTVAETTTLELAANWIDANADLIAQAADAQRLALERAASEAEIR